MAEWFVEEGIGEDRAILVQDGEIVAARLDWPDGLSPGLVEDAVIVSRSAGSSRGTARFGNGSEALVDRLPRSATEGSAIRLKIVRAAIAERGRFKLARALPTESSPRPAPSLARSLAADGSDVRVVRRFPVGGWADVIADALHAEVQFAGGSLQFSQTPAMLLIDIDGMLAPRALALAAVPALARALRLFDIGGSVGIDFPTLEAKADRKAVDELLAKCLAGWPHERTAMNGFGFVQVVARLERPSLLQRAETERAGMAARLMMRQAEQLDGPGALLLTSHPAVDSRLAAEWLETLSQRTGRTIRRTIDPALAISSPQAQLVPL